MQTKLLILSNQTTWLVVALCGLVGSSITGNLVVDRSNERRNLFIELSENQVEQDRLLEERTRLLIERGALSAYQNVDRIAIDELKMKFPDGSEQIVREYMQVAKKRKSEELE